MAKRIELFSTYQDAANLLSSIESDTRMCYVKTGIYADRSCPIYTSGVHIPNLGTTSRSDRTSSDRYMIFPNQIEVVFREVLQSSGRNLYMVDPWKNPPCILFTCGGVYEVPDKNKKCLIAGLVETAYKDTELGGLFSRIQKAVKTTYTIFKRPDLNSFVGTEALALLQSGWRLTQSYSSPPSLDLKWQPDVKDEHTDSS